MTLIDEIPKIGKNVLVTYANNTRVAGILSRVTFDMVESYITLIIPQPDNDHDGSLVNITYAFVMSIDILS